MNEIDDRPVYIYVLTDPWDEYEVRYVGKTVYPVQKRLAIHIKYAKYGTKTHVYNWIRELLREGTEPIIRIVDTATSSDWSEVEKMWIALCRQAGYLLTNITEGGDSPCHTEESRRKISEATSGENNPNFGKHPSKETLKKMSDGNKGRIFSEESRIRMSKGGKGRIFSEEHCSRISKGLKGKIRSKEHCRKLSEAAKGNTHRRGKHIPAATRLKISESLKKRNQAIRSGDSK
jgi:hypothetical protein